MRHISHDVAVTLSCFLSSFWERYWLLLLWHAPDQLKDG